MQPTANNIFLIKRRTKLITAYIKPSFLDIMQFPGISLEPPRILAVTKYFSCTLIAITESNYDVLLSRFDGLHFDFVIKYMALILVANRLIRQESRWFLLTGVLCSELKRHIAFIGILHCLVSTDFKVKLSIC